MQRFDSSLHGMLHQSRIELPFPLFPPVSDKREKNSKITSVDYYSYYFP